MKLDYNLLQLAFLLILNEFQVALTVTCKYSPLGTTQILQTNCYSTCCSSSSPPTNAAEACCNYVTSDYWWVSVVVVASIIVIFVIILCIIGICCPHNKAKDIPTCFRVAHPHNQVGNTGNRVSGNTNNTSLVIYVLEADQQQQQQQHDDSMRVNSPPPVYESIFDRSITITANRSVKYNESDDPLPSFETSTLNQSIPGAIE